MSLLVGFSVEGEGLFAVRSVRDNWFGTAFAEPLSQLGAIVGFVAEQLSGRLGAADQALSRRAIVLLPTRQQDGKKTAFSICDCVDFRVAPAARASNRLVLFPLFPPEAERCALM
jgi:hypothetical protein